MKLEEQNKIINQLLNKLYEYKRQTFNKLCADCNIYTKDTAQLTTINNMMVDENLCKDRGGVLEITKDGQSITETGGYLKHLERIELEKANQIKKLFWDTQLSKWKVKIFWYLFIISIIGGVYSIFRIFSIILK